MRRTLSFIVLVVFALAQLAMLAVPAFLALQGRTLSWQQAAESPAITAALIAAAASLLLGLPAALALWRRNGWGLAGGMLLAPLLLPVALLGDAPIRLAGHLSLGLAIGTACTLIGLGGIDRGLLRAASSAGISPAGTYRRVVLPLAMPGILAGILLSATASLAASLAEHAIAQPLPWAAIRAIALPQALAVLGIALLLGAAMAAVLALLRRP